jgi:RNA polymerase sigma factor (sigma-70 family)
MTPEERNSKMRECMPLVNNVVKWLRVDPACVSDARQAGYETVLRMIDNWDPLKLSWEIFIHGWIRPSIKRDVLREVERLESCGDIDIEGLDESDLGHDDTGGEDWGAQRAAPVVNDNNEEVDAEALRERLLAHIGRLEKRSRQILLGILAGYTVSETAENLGISQSAADRLYQKAVKELRLVMGDGAGNSPEAAALNLCKGG